MKPRLYLDEDVNPRLAVLLNQAGYDVLSARDVGALGETDRQQFERAQSSGRAIFTYNYYDFDIIAKSEAEAGRAHFGIIVSYRQYDGDELGYLAAGMRSLLDERDAASLESTCLVLPRPKPR